MINTNMFFEFVLMRLKNHMFNIYLNRFLKMYKKFLFILKVIETNKVIGLEIDETLNFFNFLVKAI